MNAIKTLVVAATLAGSTAAFSAIIPEGSYPQVNETPAAQAVQRSTVVAETARWIQDGRPGIVRGEGRPPFVQSFGEARATRDQVAADRDAWKRSGLYDAVRGPTPDFGSREFQSRLSQYHELTDSSATAE